MSGWPLAIVLGAILIGIVAGTVGAIRAFRKGFSGKDGPV
jgi:hypothetical protein